MPRFTIKDHLQSAFITILVLGSLTAIGWVISIIPIDWVIGLIIIAVVISVYLMVLYSDE